MTVQNYTAWGSADGSGITGPYNIPFPLYSQSHATILLVTNNVPTSPYLGTDYTFTSWSPLPNGQVVAPQITFTADVPNGTEIIFLLTPPGTQETAITNFSDYMPELHEQEFDLLAQKTLQLLQWAGKTIKAPDWEYAGQANLTLAPISVRASMIQSYDANGNLAYLPPSTTIIAGAIITLLNAYFGNQAGNTNGTGVKNVAFGSTALQSITSGIENTAIGNQTMPVLTTGNNNTAVGNESLASIISGSDNVALGGALSGLTNGFGNIGIGFEALESVTTASNNVALGLVAGNSVTGSGNILIGNSAGQNQTATSNTLIIDNQNRGSSGADLTDAIIVGTMASTPQTQILSLNAAIQLCQFTTTERLALTPTEGMFVYDVTLHHPFYYNNSGWVQI